MDVFKQIAKIKRNRDLVRRSIISSEQKEKLLKQLDEEEKALCAESVKEGANGARKG